MSDSHQLIAEAAAKLAGQLPPQTVDIVARAIAQASTSSAKYHVSRTLSHAHYRSLATQFLDDWEAGAAELAPETVAVALRTACRVEQDHRNAQSVELAWTGPDSEAVPFRRTEQAILEVLDSAERRITLVSYAVYKVPNVSDALANAARRDVRINVIVETPDKVAGEHEYNTIEALGDDVATCSTVYYWPRHQRSQTEAGKLGILHVKCAVADGRRLFLSSANLTEYAFTINMELGVLITGGPLPRQVEENFDRLMRMGVLERV